MFELVHVMRACMRAVIYVCGVCRASCMQACGVRMYVHVHMHAVTHVYVMQAWVHGVHMYTMYVMYVKYGMDGMHVVYEMRVTYASAIIDALHGAGDM